MAQVKTAGKTAVVNNDPPSWVLYNFDIESSKLKSEHEAFLRAQVAQTLRAGGSVSIVGLASRSGSEAHNLSWSQQRVDQTLAFLRREVPKKFKVVQLTGAGENRAALTRQADGKSSLRTLVDGHRERAPIKEERNCNIERNIHTSEASAPGVPESTALTPVRTSDSPSLRERLKDWLAGKFAIPYKLRPEVLDQIASFIPDEIVFRQFRGWRLLP